MTTCSSTFDLERQVPLTTRRHRARLNQVPSRVEMHLQSTRDQRVRIARAGLDLRFTAFETIHTESSYKFTCKPIRALMEDAGFSVHQSWTDLREWYAVTLARIP